MRTFDRMYSDKWWTEGNLEGMGGIVFHLFGHLIYMCFLRVQNPVLTTGGISPHSGVPRDIVQRANGFPAVSRIIFFMKLSFDFFLYLGDWTFIVNGRKRSYVLHAKLQEEATRWANAIQEVLSDLFCDFQVLTIIRWTPCHKRWTSQDVSLNPFRLCDIFPETRLMNDTKWPETLLSLHFPRNVHPKLPLTWT